MINYILFLLTKLKRPVVTMPACVCAEGRVAALEREVSGARVDGAEVVKLQGEVTSLQARLEEAATRTDQATRDLQREQARYKSAAKQSQVGASQCL